MTGTQRSSADLEPRRRRILFRAWHRGIREMDLVMGRFADAEIATLSPDELDELERLMEIDDARLVRWVTGERPVPAAFDTPLFRRLAAYEPDRPPPGAAGSNDGQ